MRKERKEAFVIGAGIGAITLPLIFYFLNKKSGIDKSLILNAAIIGGISGAMFGMAFGNSKNPTEKKASATGLRESPTKSTRGLFTSTEDEENKKVETPITSSDRWKLKLGVMNAKQMHDWNTGKKF